MTALDHLGKVSTEYARMAQERWLPIPGWEGLYQVSDRGRVYSVSRVLTTSHGVRKRAGGRYLRGGIGKNGRETVSLHDGRNDRKETVYVYIAVLSAFIGPRPPGFHGRHLDGNCRNNVVDNLAWGTPAENVQDMLRHGTKVEQTRTHCPRRHPLEPPNLVASKTRGARECLACSRARSLVRGEATEQHAARFQEESDRQYASLIHCPGRRRSARAGEQNGNAVMTDVTVRQLRADRAEGMSFAEIAAKYEIAVITARKIAGRALWRHVT